MPTLPAICDQCGTLFPFSGLDLPGTKISIKGSKAGPCPRCGSEGSIPDGLYSSISASLTLLQARTVDELERLQRLLQDATKDKAATQPELSNKIKTEIPELQGLRDLLPRKRSELYTFIMMLMAALTLIINLMKSGQPVKVDIHDVINNFNYGQAESVKPPVRATPEPKPLPKIAHAKKKLGRNDPCHCNSGKKYKKCCLPKESAR